MWLSWRDGWEKKVRILGADEVQARREREKRGNDIAGRPYVKEKEMLKNLLNLRDSS